jgi:UDP-2,4-diacetamido-2,4,6-trideoxy-beta-L-altropyranose hydrolase
MAERAIQALILTEAGRGRGNGHLSRCTGLLEAFHQSGHNAQMRVDSDKPLPDGIAIGDWKRDLDRFLPPDAPRNLVTVVDSYETDRMLLETIAARSRSCCFFDDYARLDYPDGTLVNAAVDADLLYPTRRDGVSYLTGPRYAVLRKAFWKKRPYPVQERIEQVIVSLGSAATIQECLDVAVSILDALPEADLILLGACEAASASACPRKGMRWLWISDTEQLIDLALESGLAVCAGGQVLIEMACLGIPAITMLTADNQKASIAGFEKAGYSFSAGPLASPKRMNLLRAAIKALLPAAERQQRSLLGRELVDGQGALRIVQALTEMD